MKIFIIVKEMNLNKIYIKISVYWNVTDSALVGR
jgi:hypothetical protein